MFSSMLTVLGLLLRGIGKVYGLGGPVIIGFGAVALCAGLVKHRVRVLIQHSHICTLNSLYKY